MGLPRLRHEITASVSCSHGFLLPSSNLLSIAGSNAPSSPSSTIPLVQDATVPVSLLVKSLLLMMRSSAVQQGSRSTDAQVVPDMKDFPDIPMSGRYWKLEEGALESSPIVSACYVGLQVHVSDGSGTVRTMSGPRSTVNIKDDGSTSTPARRCGIIQEPTLKVSSSTCPAPIQN